MLVRGVIRAKRGSAWIEWEMGREVEGVGGEWRKNRFGTGRRDMAEEKGSWGEYEKVRDGNLIGWDGKRKR